MWTGQAQIGPGWAVFHGTAGDQAPHRHHAVQLALAIDGDVTVRTPACAMNAPAVLIPADCLHQLVAAAEPVWLLYLEREAGPGRALDDACKGAPRALSTAQAGALRALLAASAVAEAPARAAALILEQPAATSSFHDGRIARSLTALPRPLPARLSLARMAKQAGLSPSRYGHLFRAHTGMPLRPYLRWLRLQQALTELAGGATLTAAAHAAGFADSAHLSRSFRACFGIAPQALRHPALRLSAA